MIQTTYEDDEDSDEDFDKDSDEEGDSSTERSGDMIESVVEEQEERETREKTAKMASMRAEKEELDLPARAKFKRESQIWKGLLRSKGELRITHSLSRRVPSLLPSTVFRLHMAGNQKSSPR